MHSSIQRNDSTRDKGCQSKSLSKRKDKSHHSQRFSTHTLLQTTAEKADSWHSIENAREPPHLFVSLFDDSRCDSLFGRNDAAHTSTFPAQPIVLYMTHICDSSALRLYSQKARNICYPAESLALLAFQR